MSISKFSQNHRRAEPAEIELLGAGNRNGSSTCLVRPPFYQPILSSRDTSTDLSRSRAYSMHPSNSGWVRSLVCQIVLWEKNTQPKKKKTKVLVTSFPRLFLTLALPLLLITLNRVDVSTPRRLDQGLALRFSTWHADKSPQASFSTVGPFGFFILWVSNPREPGDEWRVTSDESRNPCAEDDHGSAGPVC